MKRISKCGGYMTAHDVHIAMMLVAVLIALLRGGR
jgi:hypothetical protein